MAGVTFKSEKEWQAWLAKSPSAAARLKADGPTPAMGLCVTPTALHEAGAGVLREALKSPVKLATSEGVSVTARLPARSARPAPSLRVRFHRVMAWVFVVQVGLSTLGAFGCLCALLALEYVR